MDDKDNSQNPTFNDTPPEQPNSGPESFPSEQTEQNVQPVFEEQPEQVSGSPVVETSDSPAVGVAPKKRKKGLLIALIASALLLLGLGVAYVYWYQNPNKVVGDAFVHALNSKSMTYTGTVTAAGANKMVVTFNGGAKADGGTMNVKLSYEAEGKKYTLDGNGIVDEKNDLYFKVQNIDGLVNNYRRAIPSESQGLFDQIIDKVDNKWVKVSAEDLEEYQPDLVKTQECLRDSLKEMQDDDAVRAGLIDTYKKHPFITINKTLGAKDGSLGYSLTSNNETEKAFNKEFRNTSFYKSLVKCDGSFADEDRLEESTSTFSEDVTTELWVDRWSHQITKVALKKDTSGQSMNVSVEPRFNRPVSIATPKDTTTLEQLQKDVQELLEAAQSTPAASAPAARSDSMMES